MLNYTNEEFRCKSL